MTGFLTYVAAVNLAAFALMGYDKRRAPQGGWRVPESRLFALALAGGAGGILLGMVRFRHKTRHGSFRLGIPLLLLLQVLVFGGLVVLSS